MTEEEIMAMEAGQALDMRVAEDVMGSRYVKDKIFGDIQIDEGSAWMPLQPYSADKSIALPILDRIEQNYQKKIDAESFEGHWEADPTPSKGGINYCYPAFRATSLPEAICKAALLVVHADGRQEANRPEQLRQGQSRSRADTLNEIIRIELDMLQKVRTAQPSQFQESPKTFSIMREITHSVLSTETLESYLNDLQEAMADGRNLLTEKYARMQNSIPPLKVSPVINDIVRAEAEWMEELAHKYPLTFGSGTEGSQKYLASELETLSDRTLELYRRDAYRAKQAGRNLAAERYAQIFKLSGFDSLAEAEEAARQPKPENRRPN